MATCDQYQAQLLDYLYDALDAPEQEELARHLEACPACQAGLARARGQQRLLARAAKERFPSVTFTPPSATPAPVVRASTLPFVRRIRLGRGLAIAAGLLLLVGGTLAGGWYRSEYVHERTRIAQADERRMSLLDQVQRVSREL